MWIKNGLYLCLCFMAGSGIAAGYVAFITLLGIFSKLSEAYKDGKHLRHIERLIISGVTFFNLIFLLEIKIDIGCIGFSSITFLGGIFVGCLVGALAETLNIIPIISRRFGIRKLLPYAIIFAAIGKAIGSSIQLLFF